MRVRAIVPQKPLPIAKSRLGSVLSAEARAALSLTLLRTVCITLRAVADVEEVIVMTPDPEVQAHAAVWGVRALLDPRPGLNPALAEVFLSLAGESQGILVVAADLPLLRPADIMALLASGRTRALALGPSKEGIGTNAMLVPPGVTLRPAYGDASLAAHRRHARGLGLGVVEVMRPGLAFDLDTEADLLSFRAGGWAQLPEPGPQRPVEASAQTFSALGVPAAGGGGSRGPERGLGSRSFAPEALSVRLR